jgi:hypothetical protein
VHHDRLCQTFFSLHPVGSACHVVHSGASGARNVIALFFMLWWDRYRFDKNHAGPRYTELVSLHPLGSAGQVRHYGESEHKVSMHYFSCLGGPCAVCIRSALGHVNRTCVFASGGICGS